jgi:hypothetical protein
VENGNTAAWDAACERMAAELPPEDWRTAVVRMAEACNTPEPDWRAVAGTLAMTLELMHAQTMDASGLRVPGGSAYQRVAERWAGLSADDAAHRARTLARKLLEVCTADDDGGAT